MIDWSRLIIVVATHNRPEKLAACVWGWAQTAPGYREIRVVANHPDGAARLVPPARCSVRVSWRPPEHVGCMAETWNQAMILAFRDPAVEWLLCSMDDVLPLGEWPEVLGKKEADLYLAPAGDTAFLFNRRVLRDVGWFDERFTVMGYQEWDWEARAARTLGADRVVIEDAHGWRVNPIGLSDVWTGDSSSSTRDKRCEPLNGAWLREKWGIDDIGGGGFWNAAVAGQGPKVPEIDWYPWFNRSAT